MIDVKTLTPEDIGRHVIYKPFYFRDSPSDWERGVISSYREDGAVFVRFKGPNGERCSPEDLFWE
jgi:hypothetical protein